MISGFFLYQNDTAKECAMIRKWLKKSIVIISIVTCVYSTVDFYMHRAFSGQRFCINIYKGEEYSRHLWYLSALWQGLLLLLIIFTKAKRIDFCCISM